APSGSAKRQNVLHGGTRAAGKGSRGRLATRAGGVDRRKHGNGGASVSIKFWARRGPDAFAAVWLGVREAMLAWGLGTSGNPSRNTNMLQHLGKGEGQLNLVEWPGYVEPAWVKPFEQQTGCQVHNKDAGTSDEMVQLMRTGQYDGVSASGNATERLV